MEDISASLTEILEASQVPSLAAAAVVDGNLYAAGAVGVRKRGDATPVTLNDKYHIGSCTKAMTATLAGILVERRLLSWDSSLGDVFPDLAIDPGYGSVTLEQLLTHTGGFPANPHDELWGAIWEAKGSPHEVRATLVLPGLLSRPPEHSAGEFLYSNAGYTVAGAMLERVAGIPFETLLTEAYFAPLGMTSAGFGAAATLGKVDQPYGHAPDPVDPEPYGDNPPATAPAGTVHMSVSDLARHLAFHLTGTPELVRQETLERLHTPVLESYAMGWKILERPWARGPVWTHAGSNTLSYATVWVAPTLNFAAVGVCNLGTEAGFMAADEAVGVMVNRYVHNL